MTTFKNVKTGEIATETWLQALGVVTDNQEVMSELGWLPVHYDYPQYDKWRESMTPAGEPVLNADGKGWTQNFKVSPLDSDALAASLARYKEDALVRLNAKWQEAEENGTLESEVGFAIDANARADRDIRGLITKMEAKGEVTADFCAADNTSHLVTLDQLKIMQLEVIEYGQKIYALKWLKRAAIESAATFEEVDAIDLNFAMQEE